MRIPDATGFGQVQIQPGQAPQIRANTATAQAVGQLGQAVAGIATDQMAAETREQLQRKKVEEDTQAARVRVQTVNDLADLQDAVNRGVLDGTIAKDKAEDEWQARAKELLTGRLDGVAPDLAGMLSVEFENLTRRGSKGIAAAVTQRGQDEARVNLMQLGEQYQRMAEKDRPRAISEYFAQIDALAPSAGWGPDDIQKAKQGFREGTAYAQATTLVGRARDLGSIKKVRDVLASDAFADLDPQRRAQIDAQLEGRETNLVLRAEAAARAAEARREASMRRAEAEFKSAQARMDAGLFDSPEQIDRTAATLAGTPYLETYKALQQRARQGGGTAATPIPQQRAQLRAIDAEIATQGATQALVDRRAQLAKVLQASESDAKSDALDAYARRTPGEVIEPLQFSSVPQAVQAIAGRVQQAERASDWAGAPASPLLDDEAQQFGQMLAALPERERANTLAGLSKTMPPRVAAGLSRQLDPKDKTLSLSLQIGYAPTIEKMLVGKRLLSEKGLQDNSRIVKDYRTMILDEIGDAYPVPQMREDAAQAALYVVAGLADGEAASRSKAREAVRMVTGGVAEINGAKVPLAPGMSAADLEQRLQDYSPMDIRAQAPDGRVYVAGQPAMSAEDFTRLLPQLQLIYAGPGRYNVVGGGRIVTNAEGKRIVVEAGNVR